MNLWDIPPDLVCSICHDVTALMAEYHTVYDYTLDEARIQAIADVVEGCAVNHDALDAEARAAGVQGGTGGDLPW